jgi:hypothetical protein
VPYGFDKIIFDERGQMQRRLSYADCFKKPEDWTARLEPSENAEAVSTAKLIFTLYDRGINPRAIAVRLNKDGIGSARGQKWSRNRILSMLANPVYAGDQVWNRRHKGKYHGLVGGEILKESEIVEAKGARRAVTVKNDKADWVVVTDAHQGLVSRALFDRVQERLAKRATKRTRSARKFPLAGLIFCGHCGATMTGRIGKWVVDGKVKATYRNHICNTYQEKGETACRTRFIREQYLLDFVVGAIQTRYLTPSFEKLLRQEIKAQAQEATATAPADHKRLEKALAEINRKIERGTENLLLADREEMASMREMLAGWRQEREAIQAELQSSNASPVSPKDVNRIVAEACAELGRLREGIESDDPDLLRAVLTQLVERVDLWFEAKPDKKVASKFKRGLLVLRPFDGNGVICGDISEGVDFAETRTPAGLSHGPVRSPHPDRSALRQEPHVGSAARRAVPLWLYRLRGAIAARCLFLGLDRGCGNAAGRAAGDRSHRKLEGRKRPVRPVGRNPARIQRRIVGRSGPD